MECIDHVDTVLNADSVEWCPCSDFDKWLVCGTYQLKETPIATRSGTINLYRLAENSTLSLCCEQILEEPGVLDLKWNPMDERDGATLGAVNAQGCLSLFRLNKSTETNGKIEATGKMDVEPDGLALALDWSRSGACVVVSTSKGDLVVVDVNQPGLTIESRWKAHNYEVWTCAFDHTDSNVVYSGGDDCCFNVWDIRADLSTRPTKKILEHEMGVTNISVNPFDLNRLCTGSYDERMLVWDKRNLNSPLDNVGVGGGIWRIKHDPLNTNRVAVAAMHNGIHIVSLDDLSVRHSFNGHESMAYGVDWCYSRKLRSNDQSILASCSFYDNALKLLKWKIAKR